MNPVKGYDIKENVLIQVHWNKLEKKVPLYAGVYFTCIVLEIKAARYFVAETNAHLHHMKKYNFIL